MPAISSSTDSLKKFASVIGFEFFIICAVGNCPQTHLESPMGCVQGLSLENRTFHHLLFSLLLFPLQPSWTSCFLLNMLVRLQGQDLRICYPPDKRTSFRHRSLPFLQEIFPMQGLNLGLPCCRQTLYHLSHQEKSQIIRCYLFQVFAEKPPTM